MSHTQLQLTRGTAAEVAVYTGPLAEAIHDTTFGGLHLQDGATPGGRFEIGSLSVAADGLPLMNGAADRGTAHHTARADHVHPRDTGLLPLSGGTLTGQLNVNSAIVSTGNIFANGGVFADNAGAGGSNQFGFYSNGTSHYILMWPQWFWNFNISTGDMAWITPIAGNSLWTMRNDGWTYNSIGPVGGIGAYQNLSDERAKTDIAPAKVGLAEVLRIDPIGFERRGAGPKPKRHNGTTAEIGFSAQQLAAVIPEAVTVSGFQLPDGGGTHDDPNPSLTVGLETIVAALVNAVKEIVARLERLESLEA